MGMFGNFIAGAAGAGSTLLSQEALDDAKTNADLLKAQRVMDMQATQNEKLRVAGADRVKGYFAPTTENVAGAATAVDDDGNSTSANDYTKSTPATPQLALQRASEAGDMASASIIHAMSQMDEKNEILKQRSLDWAQSRDDATNAKLKIAGDINDLNNSRYIDQNGDPIPKGGISALTGKAIDLSKSDALAYLHEAGKVDIEVLKSRADLRKILSDPMLSKDARAQSVTEQNAYIVDLIKRRDDFNDRSTAASAQAQAILAGATQASSAASNPGSGVTPAFAKTLANAGSPADLANKSPAGQKFLNARSAASSLDGNKARPVASVTPVPTLKPLPPLSLSGLNPGMMLATDQPDDTAYDGRL